MRLIDADALMDELVAIQDATYMSTCISVDERNDKRWMIARAIDAVKDTPKIRAVPVVRGEWKDIPNRYICTYGDKPYRGNATSCSVCHDVNPNAFKTNYCPNCGAKMDGEKEGV